MHDQSTTPFDRRAHCAKVGERTRFQPGKVESICEDCGATFRHIPSKPRRYCSHLCCNRALARQREYARGAAHANWQGGRTPRTRARANTLAWRQLAQSIRERDGQRCQGCGRTSAETVLTTHHTVPWEVTHDDSPENLTTLCRSCHTAVDAALARIDDWPAVLAWVNQEV